MHNPYSRPAASVEPVSAFDGGLDPDAEVFHPAVFSTQGRIGRARYLAYSLAQQLLAILVFTGIVLVALPALGPERAKTAILVLAGLLYVACAVATFVATKRRLNDLDKTGWLSLLILVPLLNFLFLLYVMLWPGTPGHNSFGPKPAPNSLGVVLFALLPILFGIIAGIAVGSYLGMVQAGTLPPPPSLPMR